MEINCDVIIAIFDGMIYPVIAFLTGLLAALTDLIEKYRSFKSIFTSWSSLVYVVINGTISLLTYFLMIEFKIIESKDLLRSLVAGTSAMLILRTSFTNPKTGESIGLSKILMSFLNAAKRAFDQKRAGERVDDVGFMKKVDFDKAQELLPELCFILMKDVGDDEKNYIIDQISKIKLLTAASSDKSMLMGVALSDATEVSLLEKAVKQLGNSIALDAIEKQPISKEGFREFLINLRKRKEGDE